MKSLREREGVPAALMNAELLADAEARRDGRVVSRSSMHDLLFTRPGDPFPFPMSVRVIADGDVFEFQLNRKGPHWAGPLAPTRGPNVVAEDRARWAKAPAVLDAFLMQLVEDHPDPILSSS